MKSFKYESDIVIIAETKKDGGYFSLTGNWRSVRIDKAGKLYIDILGDKFFLPEDVQSIIQ